MQPKKNANTQSAKSPHFPQYTLPQISTQEYTQELYNLKTKIQTFESRAQTAAQQLLEKFIEPKQHYQQQKQTNLMRLHRQNQILSPSGINLGQTLNKFGQSAKQFGSFKQPPQFALTDIDIGKILDDQTQKEKKGIIYRPQTQSLKFNSSMKKFDNQLSLQAQSIQQVQRSINSQSSIRFDYKKVHNNPPIVGHSKIDMISPQMFPKREYINFTKDFQGTSKFASKFDNVQSKVQTLKQSNLMEKLFNFIDVEQLDDEIQDSDVKNNQAKMTSIPVNRGMRRTQSDQKLIRQILSPKQFALTLKDKQKQYLDSLKDGGVKSPESKQDKDKFIDENYLGALKRLLAKNGKGSKNRIGIQQQKANIFSGNDPTSPNSIKKAKNEGQNESGEKLDFLESDDSIDDKLLNEEQRSLIVEEILKADDDIVLEDTSPTQVKDDSDNEGGSPRLKKNKSGQPNKFKIIIRKGTTEKDAPGSKKLKDLEKGSNMMKYNIQSKNSRQKAINAAKEGLADEFLRAEKMQIVQHTTKEKNVQKYHLSKELMREKVMITKEDGGFRIIIPKTFKYGKLDMKNMTNEEFAQHYSSYRLSFKDIIRMIRDCEGLSQADYISKEQVATFLKKNLSKLLKQDEMINLQQDEKFNEAIRKLEQAKNRKEFRDKERELRRIKVEEEVKKKQGQILKGKNNRKTEKLLYEEQQRSKNQQALFKTVNHNETSIGNNSQNSDRNPGHESNRASNQGLGNINAKKGNNTKNDEVVQMVYATELKIKERRDENKRRLEQMKFEKEQERQKQEKQLLYNYIRDQIVKGLILRKLGHYIKEKEFQDKLKVASQKSAETIEKQYSGGYGSMTGQLKRNPIELDLKKRRNSSVKGVTNGSFSQLASINNSENESGSPLHKFDRDQKSNLFAIEELTPFDKPVRRQSKRTLNASQGGNSPEDQGDLNQLSLKLMKTENLTSKRDINSQFINIDVSPPPELEKSVVNKNRIRGSLTVSPSPFKLQSMNEKNSPAQISSQRSLNMYRRNKSSKFNDPRGDSLSPYLGRQQSGKQQNKGEDYDYYEEDDEPETNGNQKLIGQKNSLNYQEKRTKTDKVLEEEISEEEYSAGDDYGDEDGDQDGLLGGNLGGKMNMSRKKQILKTPNRLNLLNDNSINDYVISPLNKRVSLTNGNANIDFGEISDFQDQQQNYLLEDSMTEEQANDRIEQELQYQRILEKVTEKMMSKKISQFKKELLIRIALNLEQMSSEDLAILEALLDRYESNDLEVKKLIIELFQEKYQIDLTSDLGALIEEHINKVIDETKSMRRKNIKELLLKKFRMLNMIARFCKVQQPADSRKHNDNTMKLLADLLEEDDFNNSSDEDTGLLQEFQENVKDVLEKLFQKEEQNIAKDLIMFKKNYRMKFGQQPDYALREDLDMENMFGRDYQALLRVSAFLVNDEKLKQIRQKWAHPSSWVREDELFSINMTKAKRKHLYSEINNFFEDGDFGTFYELVAELVDRMRKVRSNIKQNEKLLMLPLSGIIGDAQLQNYGDFDDSPALVKNGQSRKLKAQMESLQNVNNKSLDENEKKKRLSYIIQQKRQMMSQQELEERVYCALRIAEHLETNFLLYPKSSKEDELDEFGLEKANKINNFLDPNIQQRHIERGMIPHMRDEQQQDINPLFKQMASAFRKYAQRQRIVLSKTQP